MSDLKNCPFCNSKDIYLQETGYLSYVTCNCCRSSGPIITKQEENASDKAIELWNKRHNWQSNIKDMMKAFDQEIKETPGIPNENIMKLRANLIYEEVVRELLYHMGYYITIDPIVAKDTESSYEIVLGKTYCEPSLPEIADGIVDSIVVLLGAACAMGIDIQPIWDKIHESNMAKATGPVREDGKRLKPENWQPPDIESELKKQGWSGK